MLRFSADDVARLHAFSTNDEERERKFVGEARPHEGWVDERHPRESLFFCLKFVSPRL